MNRDYASGTHAGSNRKGFDPSAVHQVMTGCIHMSADMRAGGEFGQIARIAIRDLKRLVAVEWPVVRPVLHPDVEGDGDIDPSHEDTVITFLIPPAPGSSGLVA